MVKCWTGSSNSSAGLGAELSGRGAPVSEVFHFEDGVQKSGPDPTRGNGWLAQEAKQA